MRGAWDSHDNNDSLGCAPATAVMAYRRIGVTGVEGSAVNPGPGGAMEDGGACGRCGRAPAATVESRGHADPQVGRIHSDSVDRRWRLLWPTGAPEGLPWKGQWRISSREESWKMGGGAYERCGRRWRGGTLART
jgi:hypothetical protein